MPWPLFFARKRVKFTLKLMIVVYFWGRLTAHMTSCGILLQAMELPLETLESDEMWCVCFLIILVINYTINIIHHFKSTLFFTYHNIYMKINYKVENLSVHISLDVLIFNWQINVCYHGDIANKTWPTHSTFFDRMPSPSVSISFKTFIIESL